MLNRQNLWGKCSCGTLNTLSETHCTECKCELPWVETFQASARQRAAQNANVQSANSGQTPNVVYWDNVFGSGLNDRGAVVDPNSAAARQSRIAAKRAQQAQLRNANTGQAPARVVGSLPNVPAYQFCTRCGTGLSRDANFCPNCRKATTASLTQIDGQVVKMSLNIGALVVGGFLMGALWCGVLFAAFANRGAVQTASAPGMSTSTTIQPAAVKTIAPATRQSSDYRLRYVEKPLSQ